MQYLKKLGCVIWTSILWVRQIIYWVFFTLSVVIFGSMAWLAYRFNAPHKVRILIVKGWSFTGMGLMYFILWQRIVIKGRDNIPKGACVYIAKHQSPWETITFAGLLSNITFVLKQSLLKIPFLGVGLKSFECIPIERSQRLKAFKKVIEMGQKRLKRGISIVIFPEGTRVKTGEYPKFHKTAMALAGATKSPVVPVALNSGRLWPTRGFGLIKPGVVTMVFGPCIEADKTDNDTLYQQCYDWITETTQALGG